MSKTFIPNGIMLQITHHGVKLGHAVRYGRTRCEHNAFVVSNLVNISAFQKHIGRFLCIGGGKSCNIPHFCIEEQIFERMSFVHIQAVNTKLFKGDNIIFAA